MYVFIVIFLIVLDLFCWAFLISLLFSYNLIIILSVEFGWLFIFYVCAVFWFVVPTEFCYSNLVWSLNFKWILNILHLSSPFFMITGFDIIFVCGWFLIYIYLYWLPFSFVIFMFLVLALSFQPFQKIL